MSFASNYSLFSLKFRTVLIAAAGSVVVVTPIVSLVSQTSNINFSGASSPFSIVGTGFDWLKNNFQSGIEKIPEKVQGVWSQIQFLENFSKLIDFSFFSKLILWFSQTLRSSFEIISSGFSIIYDSLLKIWPFITTIYSWIPKIYEFIFKQLSELWSILSPILSSFGWNTIPEKIKEFFSNQSFSTFLSDFKKSISLVASDPFSFIRSFLISFYNNTVHFAFPIFRAFIEEGIFGIGYSQLWNYLTSKSLEELKNALIDLMKFVKKYHSRIINMDYATIKQLVKLFLQDPNKFFEKLKQLLQIKSIRYSGNIIDLLGKSEEEIKALIFVDEIKHSIKEVKSKILGELESTVNTIFRENNENNSVSSEVKKIADQVSSTAIDIVGDIFGSLFSLGLSKKKE